LRQIFFADLRKCHRAGEKNIHFGITVIPAVWRHYGRMVVEFMIYDVRFLISGRKQNDAGETIIWREGGVASTFCDGESQPRGLATSSLRLRARCRFCIGVKLRNKANFSAKKAMKAPQCPKKQTHFKANQSQSKPIETHFWRGGDRPQSG
jgi:hypothetical protein